MALVNTADDEVDPNLLADQLSLYYAYNPVGTQIWDLYLATRASPDLEFESPRAIMELDTAEIEASPSVTADGLVIVFTARRAGLQRVWYATRTDRERAFGPSAELRLLSGDVATYEPFITRDGCELFFNGNDGTNDPQLYVARLGEATP